MLGDKVKELRKQHGITQIDLAKAIGLSQSTIGMMEKGKQGASKKTLIKLADFFGITVDYLLSNDETNEVIEMLGDKIKNLRKQKQLTQIELSTKLGIAQSTLGMIESNKRPAGRKTLIKLADFFGVTVDYLLSNDENVVVPEEYIEKYVITKKDKEQYATEMKKANEAFFLDDELSEESKKEMLDLMSELFWKAKALNKKKK